MPSSPPSPAVETSALMSSTADPSPWSSSTRTVPARSAIQSEPSGPTVPAVGESAVATWVSVSSTSWIAADAADCSAKTVGASEASATAAPVAPAMARSRVRLMLRTI
ncbi:hypothetical protein GCM10029992_55100 [Glycomyces albus]